MRVKQADASTGIPINPLNSWLTAADQTQLVRDATRYRLRVWLLGTVSSGLCSKQPGIIVIHRIRLRR